ncbi:hypothetical protein ONZ51_g7775 [Trametes cubensis]|uniref:Uncharacterized protein n=1 Tax=Trametes cubensis TaxID=1111947 RepID=A0AAD7X961_9APHY|nr:hypothetical protein ONZ51_g7775 [Trametes cubensis]
MPVPPFLARHERYSVKVQYCTLLWAQSPGTRRRDRTQDYPALTELAAGYRTMLAKNASMSLNNFETLYDSVARNASALPEQEVLLLQVYGRNRAFAVPGKLDYLRRPQRVSCENEGARRAMQPSKFCYRTEKAVLTLHFGRRRTTSHLNAAATAKRTSDGRKTHMNGAVSNGRDWASFSYPPDPDGVEGSHKQSLEIVVSDPDMRARYSQRHDCRNDNDG